MFIVISGPIGIGKSTLLKNLAKRLAETNQIGGIITLGQETKRFVDLKTQKTSYFKEEKDKKGIQIGKYFIADRALKFAAKTLETASDYDIVFIDEIGRLEVKKRGLYKSIFKLLKSINKEGKIVIFGVRQEVVHQLSRLFSIHPNKTWFLTKQPSEDFLIKVTEFIIKALMREGGL
ncbi:MAG: AAA family ATPase [Asgard group archaeon]|nr:AAA family ATPase [Asgard group archaeon]